MSGQVGIVQHPVKKRRDHRSGSGQSAAVVIAYGAAGDFHYQRIHDHIAGTGVKGGHLFQAAAGRQQRDVSDAADILQGHIFRFASVEQELCIRHQRCTQAPRSHIPDPEIADHGTAEFLGQIGRVSDLQCAPDGGVQIGHLLGNMVDRLTVIADQIHPGNAGLIQQTPDRFGIEPSQMGAQQADFPGAAAIPAAHPENGLAGGVIEALEIKTQLLHSGGKAAAGDPGKDCIDAVGGSAAHQAHHQPGGLVP